MIQSLPLWMIDSDGYFGNLEEPILVDHTEYDGKTYVVNQLYRVFLRPNNLCTTICCCYAPIPEHANMDKPLNSLWSCMRNFLALALEKHPGVYDGTQDGDLII